MPSREVFALSNYLRAELKDRTISDARHTVSLTDFLQQTCLIGRPDDLSARSVLLAVSDQLISAVAMMEIDGMASRLLVCPPDLETEHVRALIEGAGIDAIVTDQPLRWSGVGVYQVAAVRLPVWSPARARARRTTEWLTLTSHVSDKLQIVCHTSEDLCGEVAAAAPGTPPVWATFSDVRCIEGLRTLLCAGVGGGSMVLSEPGEPIADHLTRFGARGVTHVSGTTSTWRTLLMSGVIGGFAPRHVRLSGGIADQALLDGLKRAFPDASIDHADDATKAGLGFDWPSTPQAPGAHASSVIH